MLQTCAPRTYDLRNSPPFEYPNHMLVGTPDLDGVCSTGMRSQPGVGVSSDREQWVALWGQFLSYGTVFMLEPEPRIVAP